jgi:dipeptidyl aminopeptidase/acylaminoacyl peptidase
VLLDGLASAGQQTFPAQRNGRLAYNRSGTVYTVNPDGSDQRAVAGPPQFSAGDAAWSADGSRIAFQNSGGPAGGIWTIGADGTAPRRVTTDQNDRWPTWSPDGRRIGFVRFQSGFDRLFVANVDGSGVTAVTGALALHVQDPEWSPDGARFTFSTGSRIYVVNADGTNPQILSGPESGNANYPSWSPDGTRIAFAAQPTGGIRVVSAAGGTPTLLAGGLGEIWEVSWAPDGTKLGFVADVGGTFQEEVWTINADGTGLFRLNADSNVSVAWGVPSAVQPPVAGVSVNLTPVSGVVLVRIRGTSRFVPLTSLRSIPVGSELDVTRGRVRLASAAGGKRQQTGLFYQGRAVIQQPRARIPLTTLRLSGPFACPRGRLASVGATKPPRRRLWGNAKGKFRTRGKYASATVRGTKWLTEDRCDGTLVRVTAGRVEVFDQVRGRRVVVRAGQSYLARRRR